MVLMNEGMKVYTYMAHKDLHTKACMFTEARSLIAAIRWRSWWENSPMKADGTDGDIKPH